MGLDPALKIANGHLHNYKFDFHEKMAKSNYTVAKSLNYTFRFIVDITPLYNKENFDKNKSQIYPRHLELIKEKTCFKSASVLKIKIDIIWKKFNVSVNDKRETFVFKFSDILLYILIFPKKKPLSCFL